MSAAAIPIVALAFALPGGPNVLTMRRDFMRAQPKLPAMELRGGLSGAAAKKAAYDKDGDGVLDEAEFNEAAEIAADRVSGTQATDPDIIRQFEPRAGWLWRRWSGTVFEIVWPAVILLSIWSQGVCSIIRHGQPGPPTWGVFAAPDASLETIKILASINVMWTFQTSLTTFILTFFLGQCYTYWRTNFGLGRSIQGRLHDINIQCTMHAKRDGRGRYTAASAKLLEDTARNCRLMHALFWMSNEESLKLLHEPEGLKKLVARNLLTQKEEAVLLASGSPPGQRHNVVLTWVMMRFARAVKDGHLIGGSGLEQAFIANCCVLRGKMGSMPDERVDRMPLAYMHIVQILVDTLLLIAPLALYPKCGGLAVVLTALLTLFYRGLLELSKSFLDPFGNLGSKAQNINIDVLMAEANAGAPRWSALAEDVPFETASA